MAVTLSKEECAAIHELIGQLSGHNPENVFSHDGDNDPNEPMMSACAKIYNASGHSIPEELEVCCKEAKHACVVIAEGEYEGKYEFPSLGALEAFSLGIDKGAGLYGGGSWIVATLEEADDYHPDVAKLIKENLK
jgi:hypothetical protein